VSRIDELLHQLCPEGVPYVKLADLAETVSGLSGKSKSDFTEGKARYVAYKNVFANPAVDDMASDFVVLNEGERQNKLHVGDVVITGSSENIDDVGMSSVVVREPGEPLYLNSFCFALRFPKGELLPRFSKYLFRGESVRSQIRKTASGVTRINISKSRFMQVRIPVPPTAVQEAIVNVLDRLSELQAELHAQLRAELDARQLQLNYYRDFLVAAVNGPQQPMGEIGKFLRGRRFTKNDVVPSGIPSIHYGEIYTSYGLSASRAIREVRPEMVGQLRFAQPGDVIFAGVGETVEDVGKAVAWLGDVPVAVHDDTFSFTSELDPKYVAYAVQTDSFHKQKANHVARGKVKRLSSGGLERIKIPVPGIDEQQRIVSILDDFSSLVAELHAELHKEREARQKQYVHYRDRLLTFTERAQ